MQLENTIVLYYSVAVVAIIIAAMIIFRRYSPRRMLRAVFCSCGLFSVALTFVLVCSLAIIGW